MTESQPRRRITVLYDDACPLCTFQMKLLTWLDWCHVTDLLPISDPRANAAGGGIRREDLLEAIHCIDRTGRVYRGARCVRFVGMRMPLLVPLALVLWLPGAIQVAEIIYRWVSRNRHQLSRWFGCKGACDLLPARDRDGEKPVSIAPDKR